MNFILKHEENLFNSWAITNSEFDFQIWNEVFKRIITDDLAKQILYNSTNPFQPIKSDTPEVDNTNIARKNLEILTNLILKIDLQTNLYITNLTKIDLFLSSIQTAMTQILMVDEKDL